MEWMQIVSALALVMFIIILFPVARKMIRISPTGSSSDWMAFVIPIIVIILFVMLLIELV